MDSRAGDLPVPKGADFWFLRLVLQDKLPMSEVIIYQYQFQHVLNVKKKTAPSGEVAVHSPMPEDTQLGSTEIVSEIASEVTSATIPVTISEPAVTVNPQAETLTKEAPLNLPEVASQPVTKVKAKAAPFTLQLARILAVGGAALLVIYFAPTAWYKVQNVLFSGTSNFNLSGSEVQILTSKTQAARTRILPPFNPNLPLNNHLSIPSIGVDTNIQEATYDNYESALRKGVWRVSNFGQPDIYGVPMILAAHRFGYLSWTNEFRHLNSFYNLPKVKVGDTIIVDWGQRQYSYGVYKTETGTEITDYSADLILYTCESLSGPERVFVYAKLI